MSKRLKFYGWGYEDTGFDETEREHLFRFVADQLGVEPRLAPPPQEADIALRAPRIAPPAALANVLTADPYERLLHTYGKSYPETVRAFARDFANAPGPRRPAASEADVAAVLDWASGAKVAVIPFGCGSSVVGGVEPDVGEAYAGTVSLDMRRLDRVLEVDATSRAARIQSGIRGPAIEAALEAARPRHQALPAKLRVLDPRRLDRDALRRAISPRSIPTSTISSKASARSRRRASWSPAACPVRARAPARTA